MNLFAPTKTQFVVKLNNLFINPPVVNINEKTIPTAITLVTYGKKKTVCRNFFMNLIELIPIAINKAKTTEIGTVIAVRIRVLGKAY